MKKRSPFELVNSINIKKYDTDLTSYNPFLTNRAFAYHVDTILLADTMNQNHSLSPELQYDFYFYSVRKGKRFGFPPKQEDPYNLEVVMEYYQISKQKALEALRVLDPTDINEIIAKMSKGGK